MKFCLFLIITSIYACSPEQAKPKQVNLNTLQNEQWTFNTKTGYSVASTAYFFYEDGCFRRNAVVSASAYLKYHDEGTYYYVPEKNELFLDYVKSTTEHRISTNLSKEVIKITEKEDQQKYSIQQFNDWKIIDGEYVPQSDSTNFQYLPRIAKIYIKKIEQADGYILDL